jgi:hypothetical protein
VLTAKHIDVPQSNTRFLKITPKTQVSYSAIAIDMGSWTLVEILNVLAVNI